MANATLADLPAQSSAEGTDLLYIVPDGETGKKITVANLFGSANVTGTLASQPSADFSGRMFYPSDSLYAFRDSGSSWSAFGPLSLLTPPPAVNTWTWVNQSTATADETNGGIYLESASVGADQVLGLFRSAPATPYTITTCIMPNLSDDQSYSVFGLAWRNSGNGLIASVGFYAAAGNNNYLYRKWNSATSVNSDSYGIGVSQIYLRPYIWLRIADNGTNRTFSISSDGYKFNQRHTISRTDFVTPDQVGFFVDPNGVTTGMRLTSWKVT